MATKSKSVRSKSTKRSPSKWRQFYTQNKRFAVSVTAVAFVAVFSAVGAYIYHFSYAATTSPEIKSALAGGWCINDKGAAMSAGNPVVTAQCNGYAGEDWWISTNGKNIKFTNDHCLQPQNGYVGAGTKLVIQPCNGKAEQNWTRSSGGYINDKSGNCLTAPNGNTNVQLTIQACSSNTDQNWSPATYVGCDSGYHASVATAKCIAHQQLANYGWDNDTQFSCLNNIFSRESGWQWNANNPGSGAYGIPQALPGSKMASAGSDWHDNAATQIQWGLGYIKSRYGTPCAAWAFWQGHNWYITNTATGVNT